MKNIEYQDFIDLGFEKIDIELAENNYAFQKKIGQKTCSFQIGVTLNIGNDKKTFMRINRTIYESVFVGYLNTLEELKMILKMVGYKTN